MGSSTEHLIDAFKAGVILMADWMQSNGIEPHSWEEFWSYAPPSMVRLQDQLIDEFLDSIEAQ